MVKIIRKEKMTLEELIKWAWENNISKKSFNSKKQINALYFDSLGRVQTHCNIDKNDIFIVNIEEEITEDTKVKKLSQYTAYGFKTTRINSSIKEEKDENSLAFYIMRDDREMTLIWTKENGLVGE